MGPNIFICSMLPHKFYKVILSEKLFVLLLLELFGTSCQILKLKDQKCVFWIISPIMGKKLKIKQKLSTTHKFYVD